MILVDTNILIALILAADPKHLGGLLQQYDAAVCGIVRAELLHGARSPAERKQAIQMLDTLASVPLPESIWDQVGDNLRILRSDGVTVPLSDAVLATLAINSRLELWTRDAHFSLIQRALPTLKLFQEPK